MAGFVDGCGTVASARPIAVLVTILVAASATPASLAHAYSSVEESER
jgi:hypothetical protein